ncbi:uncharacterized protein FIBRA_08242 [Fibroporia radiculosa]|uniref:NAD(P)-binding protein n=1 Tax=Fibroporia radiculosa TaxID=599839 RepID=J4H525_9APHY|nr:uncharacterized protein FIBRA_08242 [Fibroporia radiculosa]CCM05999.1 predicted protein [Fibroporia radiculosa]
MSSQSFIWLITGASRGLGFELTKQVVASASNIAIACCRNPDGATKLRALQSSPGKLHLVVMDVGSEKSMRDSVHTVDAILAGRGIDYLYNNAGIALADDTPYNLSYEHLLEVTKVNVAAPALLAQLYLPYIEKSQRKVIVNVSSSLSSIASDRGTKHATYCITKTAMNMLTYKQAKTRPDVTVIAIDPGFVRTDLTGPHADLDPEESISGVLKVLTTVTTADSGKFLRYNGTELPW